MNTLYSVGRLSRGSQRWSVDGLPSVTSTHGGEGAEGQKFFLPPSRVLSLSHTEEELEEAVRAVTSTHTEASDEVRLS